MHYESTVQELTLGDPAGEVDTVIKAMFLLKCVARSVPDINPLIASAAVFATSIVFLRGRGPGPRVLTLNPPEAKGFLGSEVYDYLEHCAIEDAIENGGF